MDPLEELNKATRSVRVSIHNNTGKKLVLKSHPIISGQWRVNPPDSILPLSTVEFGSESGNLLGGTEAGSIYTLDGAKENDGQFEFFWNNPVFGKKGFRRVSPANFESDYVVVDGHNCILRFTVKEIDNGTKEIEDYESEIKNLTNYMNEAEVAIKGMTKMSQVYQAQNDSKQVKLVEGNIKEKSMHLEEMKTRKELLLNQIQKMKQLDSDPKAMEQVLNKIRESIESLVKARKGMEHMREVYERSKDLKSMEGLDSQIEVKKNEIDALRKKEQKVIQKVIELKKSLGIGATGIPTKKRVKALYAYAKSSEDELSIEAGDIIEIVHDEDTEWYGGLLNNQMGYFPRSFVTPLDSEPDQSVSGVDSPAADDQDFTDLYPKARVIYDHTAADEGELTLRVGDVISVFSWEDEYWWEGLFNDKSGYFPCNCVDWIEPEDSLTNTHSYSYYESNEEESSNEVAAPVAPTPTPTPVVVAPTPVATVPKSTFTPAKTPSTTPSQSAPILTKQPSANIQPPPAPFTAPVLNRASATHSPVNPTPVPTPTPTPAPAAVENKQIPRRELPSAPANKPVHNPVVHNPAPVHTPAPAVVSHTPVKPEISHSPLNHNNNNNNTNNTNTTPFDKLIQPFIQEFTKQLVETHQKETNALHQRIAQLEKELKEAREGGSNTSSPKVTSTATIVSKAVPTRKY
ncbi:hypothetical protein CYY_002436 [Polysphondylium violaceum]|uniref:SH3 domain-containing protein n=1 Tax=Polysphondylium violaceum TaxID=133409 RepID=A0A8J4V2R2_9MYCE|nr:hypothetical protein CYY_002436 [Polysphondylium violaceum]